MKVDYIRIYQRSDRINIGVSGLRHNNLKQFYVRRSGQRVSPSSSTVRPSRLSYERLHRQVSGAQALPLSTVKRLTNSNTLCNGANRHIEAYTNPNLTIWEEYTDAGFPKNRLIDDC